MNDIKPNSPVEQARPAFCGFDCALCPICMATVNDDDALREELARKYSTVEKKLTKADIMCCGCKSEKRYLHPFCEECAIRCCALAHGVSVNCGECAEYPCPLIIKRIPEGGESRSVMDETARAGRLFSANRE